MADRTPRYTEAQRAQFRQNAQRYNAQARYGSSYADQGLTGEKDAGKAFLAETEQKKQYGAFYDPTWQYSADGTMRRPMAGQGGRIAAQGGNGPQWEAVPEYAQHSAQKAQAYFSANPGAGWDQYIAHNRVSNALGMSGKTGYTLDQATGIATSPAGESWYLATGQRAPNPAGWQPPAGWTTAAPQAYSPYNPSAPQPTGTLPGGAWNEHVPPMAPAPVTVPPAQTANLGNIGDTYKKKQQPFMGAPTTATNPSLFNPFNPQSRL